MFGTAHSLYGYFRLVVCTFGNVVRLREAVELIILDVTSDPTNTTLTALVIADIPIMMV